MKYYNANLANNNVLSVDELANKPIHLNVRGTIMTVSLGDFIHNEREPDSLFKKMFTGQYLIYETPSKKFKDSIYYINCDPIIFKHILDWLILGRLASELSVDMKNSLIDASDMFKLNNLSKKLEDSNNSSQKERMKMSQFDFMNLANLARSHKITLNLSGLDLRGLVLQKTNLEHSEIISSDFSGMNLTLAKFKNSILSGSNFSNCNLTNVDFRGCDLSECDFSNAILKNTDMSNTNLSNASFENAKLEKTKFQQCKFEKTLGLNGLKLISLDFTKSSFIKCKMNGCDLTSSNFSEGVTFKECDLSDSILTKVNFTNCTMSECNLENETLKNTTFAHCNLERTILKDNQLIVHLFSISDRNNFNNVTFDKCTIKLHFNKFNLKECKLIDCNLNGSIFQGIDYNIIESLLLTTSFNECTFSNCNLLLLKDLSKFKGSTFDDCKFNFEQFTNKSIENIQFNSINLKSNNFDLTSQQLINFEFKNVKYQDYKFNSTSFLPYPSSNIVHHIFSKAILSHTNSKSTPQLLYRGSRDGFNAIDFHSRCDNQGPTLTIIKSVSSNGPLHYNYQIFGGFTTQSWNSSPLGEHISDDSAFIFKIDNEQFRKFNVKQDQKQHAILSYQNCLPRFGSYDICISSGSGNESNSNFGQTYELPDNIQPGSEKAKNYLAGSKNFNVCEIEVFKIIQ